MEVLLVEPRGFCAGVQRAIESVEWALRTHGASVYVLHEIVHNRHVVADLMARGVVFVDRIDQVPEGSQLIYSAHGVSPALRDQAFRRRLRVIDATCPLVTKVHREAVRLADRGFTIFYIGHAGHDEVVGTMGEAADRMVLVQTAEEVDQLSAPDPGRTAYLTQTTLSVDDCARIVDALHRRFPAIVGPRSQDICYATQNRQTAVKELAPRADVALVIGSPNSSNSTRLAEIAAGCGVPSYLVDDVGGLSEDWLDASQRVLLTAGASAPEELVREVVAFLVQRFDAAVHEVVVCREATRFPLPPELDPGPAEQA